MREGGWRTSIRGFLGRVFQAGYEDNIPFLASAIAFDALLAAIPFFLLVLSGLGYLIRAQLPAGEVDLHLLLSGFFPEQAATPEIDPFGQAEALLGSVVESRGALSLYGAPLFLWFATRLFGGIRAALNEVFDTEETRPYLLGKLWDAVLVLGTGALLVTNGIVTFWVSVLAVRGSGFSDRLVGNVIAFFASSALFFVVYKLVPSRRIGWDTALIAALVCSVAFELAKLGFGIYLRQAVQLSALTANASIGAIVLFVIWVYFTAYVFLVGGEVAETYDLMKTHKAQRAILA